MRMAAHGFSSVELIEHSYENEIDLTYIAGHLYSAMPQTSVPAERRPEFQSGLQRALLAEGTVTERIDATALIGRNLTSQPRHALTLMHVSTDSVRAP